MPPKSKSASAQHSPAEEDSDASEEMSDPELDFDEDEHEALLNFDCTREAARERLAPRTRHQYDLFMGLMARFFTSQSDLKKFVVDVDMTCTVPLPTHAVARYLNYVEAKKVEYKPGHFKPVSTSYYKAAVNCIHDKYTCEQVLMQEDLRLLLFSRKRIFRRRITDLKASGQYPQPPNRCISSHGYTLLCEALAKAKPAEEGGWAWQLVSCIWCYVVFLWNLLARCDRVAQLRWENFTWTCDSLTVFIPKSKSDQCGDRAYCKKLFTASNPTCCPVLALAVQFFGRDSTRSEFIFPRADTRRAGLRQLTRLLQLLFTVQDWALFGCNPLSIAWHHFKRGGITFLSSMMDGPSHAAIKLRGDQTIMDVSRFYIMQSTGQDGYIGRLLAMLPYGEHQFCQQEYSLPAETVIQSGLPADVCESNVASAFKRGWVSLELYLRLQHQVNIDADAAPSSLYETVMKLGDAFKPPLIATLHAAHTGTPRSLPDLLQEHLNVLAAAEACAGASAARQTVLVAQLTSALQRPPKRGRPAARGGAVAVTGNRPLPAAVAERTPAVAAAEEHKCCCGVIFETPQALKRHHNGAGGKRPREPVHACTAGCTF